MIIVAFEINYKYFFSKLIKNILPSAVVPYGDSVISFYIYAICRFPSAL